jgi:Na+-transporting methylmalonyl-CoA/oxaloacetate decarboxylase gamma subunit
VFPALAGLVLVLCAGVAGLAAGYHALGVGVPFAFLALLALVVPLVAARLRPPARRRRGYYTAREIAELDAQGLALAVSRMLRRDGWSVRPPTGERVRPRVRARHRRGLRLEVAFRPVAEPLPDEDPRRPAAPAGPVVQLIVHRGMFADRDVRWAGRRGDIRLMDGALLRRWAEGTPLERLIDLGGET